MIPMGLAKRRPTEAFRPANLFDAGIGNVVITRFKADGRAESGVFLLDVHCLGVKDAFFCQFNTYEECRGHLIARMSEQAEMVPMTPPAARKLVEDAIAYAARLGFAPARDYKQAARVFGGISAAECGEEFVFGEKGKPLFVAGPNDSPARCRRILACLHAHCGPDGYHYVLPVDVADEITDAPWFDPPGGAGPRAET